MRCLVGEPENNLWSLVFLTKIQRGMALSLRIFAAFPGISSLMLCKAQQKKRDL